MKKILLAGPGTGKTRKVKVEFLKKVKDFEKVLILSFTNVTVNDLRDKFAKDGIAIGEKNCMTLHSFALKINHKRELHILNNTEEYLLKRYSTSLKIDFVLLCEMLNCISYDQMVISLVEFAKINSVYLKEQIGELELLIVDEYQDFNDFEQSLVNLISDNAEETLILGDDDQCIYDFKDATSDGIIALHSDASITKIPHENKCYRCPDTVVEKCTNLISNNKQRVLKDWHPTGIDGLVHFQQISTIPETIEWVSKKIKEIKEENEKTTILVLSPVKFAVEGLSEELDKNNIKNVNFFKDNTDMNMVEMIWKLRLVYSSKSF